MEFIHGRNNELNNGGTTNSFILDSVIFACTFVLFNRDNYCSAQCITCLE